MKVGKGDAKRVKSYSTPYGKFEHFQTRDTTDDIALLIEKHVHMSFPRIGEIIECTIDTNLTIQDMIKQYNEICDKVIKRMVELDELFHSINLRIEYHIFKYKVMEYNEINELYSNDIGNHIDPQLIYEYDNIYQTIYNNGYGTIIGGNSQCLKLRAEYEDGGYSYAYLYKDSEYIFITYDDKKPNIEIYNKIVYSNDIKKVYKYMYPLILSKYKLQNNNPGNIVNKLYTINKKDIYVSTHYMNNDDIKDECINIMDQKEIHFCISRMDKLDQLEFLLNPNRYISINRKSYDKKYLSSLDTKQLRQLAIDNNIRSNMSRDKIIRSLSTN